MAHLKAGPAFLAADVGGVIAGRHAGCAEAKPLAGLSGSGLHFFGVSMPSFWVGLLLMYLLALKLNWLPVTSINGGFERLIMPALTLAFAMSAKYTRQVRAAVLEELRQDYVIGARCRGLKESTILWRHIFPNALLPLITLLGLSLGSLLGGTAVVETILWPVTCSKLSEINIPRLV